MTTKPRGDRYSLWATEPLLGATLDWRLSHWAHLWAAESLDGVEAVAATAGSLRRSAAVGDRTAGIPHFAPSD